MPVRSTMSSLIARVRLLINDTTGPNQIFSDQDIQDVLDESRWDISNKALRPSPTFSGPNIQYLDYYAEYGGWEGGMVLKQYLTNPVTPSAIEPIVGHFTFAQTTLPPVMITGQSYDVYRAAADLLERMAAKWVLQYDFVSNGQNFRRSQATSALLTLAQRLRLKQRATSIDLTRSDLAAGQDTLSLKATETDYMAKG